MNTISTRLQQVLAQIENAASASLKKSSKINLLAVSKTNPVEQVKALYAVGQRKFGENYLQEALEKITNLQQQGNFTEIEWQIGRAHV